LPKQGRGAQAFARRNKAFPTEAEARQYAKEIFSGGNKVIAGTLLGAERPGRRISGSHLYRWIEDEENTSIANDPWIPRIGCATISNKLSPAEPWKPKP
jgi:hypothetical protein